MSEGTYEGQRGVVTSVRKYITESPEEPRYRLQLRNEATKTNHRTQARVRDEHPTPEFDECFTLLAIRPLILTNVSHFWTPDP